MSDVEKRPDSAEGSEDRELDEMLRGKVTAAFDSVSLGDEAATRILVALQSRQFENEAPEGEPAGAAEAPDSPAAAPPRRRVLLYRVGFPVAACLLLVAVIVGVTSMGDRYNRAAQTAENAAGEEASVQYGAEGGAEGADYLDGAYDVASSETESRMSFDETTATDGTAEKQAAPAPDPAEAGAGVAAVRLEDGTAFDVATDADGRPDRLDASALGAEVGRAMAVDSSGLDLFEVTVYECVSRPGSYAAKLEDGVVVALDPRQ